MSGTLRQRSGDSAFRFGLEELKFIRSYHDLRIFGGKMKYLIPRMLGTLDRVRPVPPSLQLEPTNYCNSKCISCPVSRSNRPRGHMPFLLFKKIVDDAVSCGVTRIRLFLHGEPLLHPGFVEMVRYLKEHGCSVHVTTNGTLFSEETIYDLFGAGIDTADHFTFSVHGHSSEVHEQITRTRSYHALVRNIFDFTTIRDKLRRNGPVIETIFYRMPKNAHEEEDYLTFWRTIVDHARLGGPVSESFSGYKSGQETLPPRKKTCVNLWDKMTVFWNGDVTLCNEDVDGDHVYGNLRENSIAELWHHAELNRVRDIHRRGEFESFPFCAQCDM